MTCQSLLSALILASSPKSSTKTLMMWQIIMAADN